MKKHMFCGTCNQIPCCCGVRKNHAKNCKFRRAIEVPIGLECKHGYDVCPTCDPCTCGTGLIKGDIR